MQIIKLLLIILSIFNFIYIKSVSISYTILSHNETESLEHLLELLSNNIDNDDEVIILDDFSVNQKTLEILNKFSKKNNFKVYKRSLNYNFAEQRNYANSFCKGQYIFSIDADEIPSLNLLQNLKKIINPNIDAYKIPLIIIMEDFNNFELNNKLNNKTNRKELILLKCFNSRINNHFLKSINQDGWIFWPAYKLKLFKNKKNIYWQKPIHEYINPNNLNVGILPAQENFAIKQKKTIECTKNSYFFYFECYKKWFLNSLKNNDVATLRFILEEINIIYENKKAKYCFLDDIEIIEELEKKKLFYLINELFKENFYNGYTLSSYLKNKLNEEKTI